MTFFPRHSITSIYRLIYELSKYVNVSTPKDYLWSEARWLQGELIEEIEMENSKLKEMLNER